MASLLRPIAADRHGQVGGAGQLITVYSLVYAFASPILVRITRSVDSQFDT
jgi:DHA1 family purine base/nucleoside efflux pump-like MFS transporter